jgi:hypothetical protein
VRETVRTGTKGPTPAADVTLEQLDLCLVICRVSGDRQVEQGGLAEREVPVGQPDQGQRGGLC